MVDLSFLSVHDLFYGILSGVLPGLHPMLFPLGSPSSTAFAYGLYSAISIIPAVYFKAYTAETAYLADEDASIPLYLAGLLAGLVFVFFYLPFLEIFSVRPPREVILFVLLVVSALILKEGPRAVFVSFLSAAFGLFTLKMAIGVKSPLIISVMGLFGGYALFSKKESKKEERGCFQGVVAGIIAGMIVGYFPAMSVSLALLFPSFFIPTFSASSAVGAATSVSLSVSLFSKLSGVTRSAFSADLPYNFDLLSVLVFFSLGVVFGSFLVYFLERKRISLDRRASIGFMLLFAFLISGISGVALFTAAVLLALTSAELKTTHKPLMFYFIAPTFVYYI